MPKNKVSEWSATASNNTDIGGINIAEGCAPSGINNAIRELMAQVKDMQSGTDADNFVVGGNLTVTGTATGATPSVSDDSTKFATTAFVRDIIPTGVIVMWSGTIATIPSGWVLCDGSNSTPDLRNRFIIGANADDGGAAKTNVTGSATQTGGSKDAIVVSHTHTATVTDPSHSHSMTLNVWRGSNSGNTNPAWGGGDRQDATNRTQATTTAATGISVSNSTEGSSGTNANLVPYYALAFIMKS
jgi:microcystin-dependent protein